MAPAVAPALCLLVAAAVAARALPGAHPHAGLGPANAVTLLRAALAALLVAPILMPGGLAGRDALAWGLTLATAGALVLDGLDGWLARRSGLASPFGARFDMEVDAGLAALLSVLALASGKAGAWVLLLGFMRYGFVAAAMVWPWLLAPLPGRHGRKTVCVIQIATLTALMAPPVVPPLSGWAVGLALALLVWSFAVDVLWLRARRVRA
ncbi:MAG: CDP-alcohol phosphatidyltransferase family protein [Gemmobacter sp.]